MVVQTQSNIVGGRKNRNSGIYSENRDSRIR